MRVLRFACIDETQNHLHVLRVVNIRRRYPTELFQLVQNNIRRCEIGVYGDRGSCGAR
jgi:hypothetical protein